VYLQKHGTATGKDTPVKQPAPLCLPLRTLHKLLNTMSNTPFHYNCQTTKPLFLSELQEIQTTSEQHRHPLSLSYTAIRLSQSPKIPCSLNHHWS